MTDTGEVIRASHRDRGMTVRVLRGQVRAGRLSDSTFVLRLRSAIDARNRGQLNALVADLPGRPGLFRRLTARLFARPATAGATAAPTDVLKMTLPPAAGIYVVGRNPEAHLRLNHDSVSRQHALLTSGEDGGWTVTDLGSVNGTWVNGWRIAGPTPVQVGDLLFFGQHRFVLVTREAMVEPWQPPPAGV